jgi:Synergist-CTERM protein sorting domain-containing protein
VQWEIYKGEGISGEPFETVSAWAPQVTFDEPGMYTVVLNVGGLAGTGAAVATFEVEAGNNAETGTCSQVGGGATGALLALLPLLGLRRRR